MEKDYNPYTGEPFVPFIAERKQPSLNDTEVLEATKAAPPSRISKLGNALCAGIFLAGAGMVAYEVTTSETAAEVFTEATEFMNNDKSVSHGANDPEVQKQRELIAEDKTADVFAFSIEDAPSSTVQTSCEKLTAEIGASPWSVAEHYARKYELGETKVNALVNEITVAVESDNMAGMQQGEQFVVCVRQQQDTDALNGN